MRQKNKGFQGVEMVFAKAQSQVLVGKNKMWLCGMEHNREKVILGRLAEARLQSPCLSF